MEKTFNVNDYTDRDIAYEAMLYLEAESGKQLSNRGSIQMSIMMKDDFIKESRKGMAEYDGQALGDGGVPEIWERVGNPIHNLADKYFELKGEKLISKLDEKKDEMNILVAGLDKMNTNLKVFNLDGTEGESDGIISYVLDVEADPNLKNAYKSLCSKVSANKITVSVAFSNQDGYSQISVADEKNDLIYTNFFVMRDDAWNTDDKRHEYLEQFVSENGKELLALVKSQFLNMAAEVIK